MVTTNGVNLYVEDRGEGSPVLLLHGFPDSSNLWRQQVPALNAAGFRTIAPDLRGFGASDRPDGVGSYAITNLVLDAVGLLDELGIDKAQVVGHDWGAAVAWVLAAMAPDRVEQVAALSVGHPSGYFGTLRQREMSWYMLLFHSDQAEELLRKDDWRFIRLFLSGGDTERYIQDLSRPGALTAALNVYRANIGPASFVDGGPVLPPITCPAMGVWSSGDLACGEEAMKASRQFVAGPWRYERVEGANHWIPLTAPDRLNEILLGFLQP